MVCQTGFCFSKTFYTWTSVTYQDLTDRVFLNPVAESWTQVVRKFAQKFPTFLRSCSNVPSGFLRLWFFWTYLIFFWVSLGIPGGEGPKFGPRLSNVSRISLKNFHCFFEISLWFSRGIFPKFGSLRWLRRWTPIYAGVLRYLHAVIDKLR